MNKDKFLEITSYIGEITKGTEFEHHIYAVGGSVRSLVMGREIKDIDLVIDIPEGGVRFAQWCKDNGYTGGVVMYPTYGTAMFRFGKFPDDEIECVMTRGEKYTDAGSRNPTVEFTSLKDDALRRDLTINALYYDISKKEILDPTGFGIEDIENKICRVPMEVKCKDFNRRYMQNNIDYTFISDPLRILRCIRFSCRFGFEISEKTYESMKRNVDRLSIITVERINDELCKILMSKDAHHGIMLINDIGAMKYVIPELEKTIGLGQNAYHFGDVWVHTMAVLENDCNLFEPDLICRLAALLHDIGKIGCRTEKDGKVHFYGHEDIGADIAREALRRLKFDNHTIDEVCFIIKNHMRAKGFENDCHKMKDKAANKFMYVCGTRERFGRVCRVIEDDNLAHERNHCITGQYAAFMECADKSKMFGYKLPIDGNDMMEGLGIGPGPAVKEVLKGVMAHAFNNPDITRESCMKIMKGVFRNINKTK